MVQSGTNRYTCVITTVDPNATTSTGAPAPIVEGAIKSGKTIQISLYNISPTFRWPVVGETWMVIQYNSSWYLDGIFELQNTSANYFTDYDQGDLVLDSQTGKVAVIGTPTNTNGGNNDFEIYFNGANLVYANGGITYPLMPMVAGVLVPTALSTLPGGLLCDGGSYLINDYPTLSGSIRETYGGEDDDHFYVPMLSGRLALGAGTPVTEPGGSTPVQGGSNWALGHQPASGEGGEQTHILTSAEMPPHNHAVSDPGHAHNHALDSTGGYTVGNPISAITGSSTILGNENGGFSDRYGNETSGGFVQSATTGIGTQNTGGGTGHNILPPVSVINWFVIHG